MISEYINGIDWVGEFKDKNVQESYTEFLRHYNKACELYIPKIDKTVFDRYKFHYSFCFWF